MTAAPHHPNFSFEPPQMSEFELITLYDIPCKYENLPWSCNAWKVRYALNYKGLRYRTAWIEYPDIEALCLKLGAPPTGFLPDGSKRAHYTLPVIHDPRTGRVISDSARIARYLDDAYPDTLRLFPVFSNGRDSSGSSSAAIEEKARESASRTGSGSGTLTTHALHAALQTAFLRTVGTGMSWIAPHVYGILRSESRPYLRATREAWFGVSFNELRATQDIRELKEALDVVDSWFKANPSASAPDGAPQAEGDDETTGGYLMGDSPSYSDFFIASYIKMVEAVLGRGKQWDQLASWNNGRWGRLVQDLEKYAQVF